MLDKVTKGDSIILKNGTVIVVENIKTNVIGFEVKCLGYATVFFNAAGFLVSLKSDILYDDNYKIKEIKYAPVPLEEEVWSVFKISKSLAKTAIILDNITLSAHASKSAAIKNAKVFIASGYTILALKPAFQASWKEGEGLELLNS